MSAWSGTTILVCGISGVGKTSLIQVALGKFLAAVTWRASEIIAEARSISDPERLRALPPEEIHRSQEFLVSGFEARRRAFSNEIVILDAHSVIDTDNGLFDVPVDVVKRLRPAGIIHVSDDIERIEERRLIDLDRVRVSRSLAKLQEYQMRSIAVCEGYQAALGVPLLHVRAGHDAAFAKAIQDIIALQVSSDRQ
jgi:adenylate kinase